MAGYYKNLYLYHEVLLHNPFSPDDENGQIDMAFAILKYTNHDFLTNFTNMLNTSLHRQMSQRRHSRIPYVLLRVEDSKHRTDPVEPEVFWKAVADLTIQEEVIFFMLDEEYQVADIPLKLLAKIANRRKYNKSYEVLLRMVKKGINPKDLPDNLLKAVANKLHPRFSEKLGRAIFNQGWGIGAIPKILELGINKVIASYHHGERDKK
jgi:hypothetical protein